MTPMEAAPVRERRIRRVYGMTSSDYARMCSEQGGRCAICRDLPVPGNSGNTTLCIDHDHQTGRVRGLLCHACNRALGNMKDDPALLERAVAYLRGRGEAIRLSC